VRREAQKITASRYLQFSQKQLHASHVLGFEMTAITTHLESSASTFMQVLRSIATSTRQLKSAGAARMAKKAVVRLPFILDTSFSI
jgi:hypothetical protein